MCYLYWAEWEMVESVTYTGQRGRWLNLLLILDKGGDG